MKEQLPGLQGFKFILEDGCGPEKVLNSNTILHIGQEVQLRADKNMGMSRSKNAGTSKQLMLTRNKESLLLISFTRVCEHHVVLMLERV